MVSVDTALTYLLITAMTVIGVTAMVRARLPRLVIEDGADRERVTRQFEYLALAGILLFFGFFTLAAGAAQDVRLLSTVTAGIGALHTLILAGTLLSWVIRR